MSDLALITDDLEGLLGDLERLQRPLHAGRHAIRGAIADAQRSSRDPEVKRAAQIREEHLLRADRAIASAIASASSANSAGRQWIAAHGATGGGTGGSPSGGWQPAASQDGGSDAAQTTSETGSPTSSWGFGLTSGTELGVLGHTVEGMAEALASASGFGGAAGLVAGQAAEYLAGKAADGAAGAPNRGEMNPLHARQEHWDGSQWATFLFSTGAPVLAGLFFAPAGVGFVPGLFLSGALSGGGWWLRAKQNERHPRPSNGKTGGR